MEVSAGITPPRPPVSLSDMSLRAGKEVFRMITSTAEGSREILKFLCFRCNRFYYFSLTGDCAGNDYLFEAADRLTGAEKVTFSGEALEQLCPYETDNDYERYGILHASQRKRDGSLSFVRGERYDEFMPKLFRAESRGAFQWSCPYCGGFTVGMSSIDRPAEEYWDGFLGIEIRSRFRGMADAEFCTLQEEVAEEPPHSPLDASGARATAYIRILAEIEWSLFQCALRGRKLPLEVELSRGGVLHDYVEEHMPRRSKVTAMPAKKTVSGKDPDEARREKENLKAEQTAARQSRAAFDEEMQQFWRNLESIRNEALWALSERHSAFLQRFVPIRTMEPYWIARSEQDQNRKAVRELLRVRRRFLALDVLEPEYAESPYAVMILHEYLRQKICSRPEGKNGAYEKFQAEYGNTLPRVSTLRMVADCERGLRWIAPELREKMREIQKRAESLEASIHELECAKNEELDGAITACWGEKGAYYADVERCVKDACAFLHALSKKKP